ncbi:hypothetical protein ACRAWC_23385 [Leifsonia sp. L25]|uniref:hypothetical protein n=1 Tax=Leifsonia sp. L25 TaxID=3423957 RepID=UPI003D697A4F
MEAELMEGEPGDVVGGDDAEAQSGLLDTQAIDVVEIVESDPGSRVLEEHVAEQERTREFVIEDEAGICGAGRTAR